MNDHFLNKDFCLHHPKQILVGVCPSCLTQKLLVVLDKQSRQQTTYQTNHSRKPSHVSLPKILSFGSLLTRLPNKQQSTSYDCDEDEVCSTFQSTSTSLEDSFISIKFEDNGVALWDENDVEMATQEDQTTTNRDYKDLLRLSSWKRSSRKSMVGHLTKTRGSMRWRRKIGRLLQMVKWKRPNNKTLSRKRSCKE